MKIRKSISINMLFNVSYNLLNMLFPFITSVYLSRVLGPEYIGRVSYAQNIMQYFVVIASLGIPTYGMKKISRDSSNKKQLEKTFSELFCLNLISTLICSVLYTTLVSCVGMLRADLKLFLCVGLTLYMNIFNVEWFFSGQEEYAYITIRSLCVKVISIVCIFLFVKNQNDYLIYAIITSFAITGNYVLNIWNLRKKIRLCFKEINMRQHIRPVLLLLAVMFATDIYNQIDVTMLGVFCEKEDVGYYSNVIKIIRIATSLMAALSAPILPRMCTFYKEKDNISFHNLYNRTLKIIILVAFPAALGLWLISSNLVMMLWGPLFLPAISIIKTLAVIIPIISISYLSGSIILTASDNENKLLIATFLGAFFNVIGNFILIPMLEGNGAAIASVLSEVVVLIIHIYFAKEYLKVEFNYRFMGSVLVSLFSLGIVVVSWEKMFSNGYVILLGQIVSGAITYAGMLLLTKNEVADAMNKTLLCKIKSIVLKNDN